MLTYPRLTPDLRQVMLLPTCYSRETRGFERVRGPQGHPARVPTQAPGPEPVPSPPCTAALPFLEDLGYVLEGVSYERKEVPPPLLPHWRAPYNALF